MDDDKKDPLERTSANMRRPRLTGLSPMPRKRISKPIGPDKQS
jgi:hypothetical protein